MTPACGAGGPGFKSQRARHILAYYANPFDFCFSKYLFRRVLKGLCEEAEHELFSEILIL